jgi:hypothetical protein
MTLLLATLALLPFGLAVLAHTARPSLPLSIAAPERPPLVFDQYLVDLGEVEPSTEVRGSCSRTGAKDRSSWRRSRPVAAA